MIIDVENDPGGREKLHALGVRSLPIVLKNGEFVRGQNLEDVARMIGANGTGYTQLPPDQLIEKWVMVLNAAQRYIVQFSNERLAESVIPNRKRSIRRLCHHIFRIPESFLETALNGANFDHGTANRTPPDDKFHTSDELVRFGADTTARLRQWWDGLADKSCQRQVETYFGTKSLHVLFERCAWHSAQHTRQIIAVLERYGVEPHGRLTAKDLEGLPLPERLFE